MVISPGPTQRDDHGHPPIIRSLTPAGSGTGLLCLILHSERLAGRCSGPGSRRSASLITDRVTDRAGCAPVLIDDVRQLRVSLRLSSVIAREPAGLVSRSVC